MIADLIFRAIALKSGKAARCRREQ